MWSQVCYLFSKLCFTTTVKWGAWRRDILALQQNKNVHNGSFTLKKGYDSIKKLLHPDPVTEWMWIRSSFFNGPHSLQKLLHCPRIELRRGQTLSNVSGALSGLPHCLLTCFLTKCMPIVMLNHFTQEH